jgi:hypothetical protein
MMEIYRHYCIASTFLLLLGPDLYQMLRIKYLLI